MILVLHLVDFVKIDLVFYPFYNDLIASKREMTIFFANQTSKFVLSKPNVSKIHAKCKVTDIANLSILYQINGHSIFMNP